MPITVGDVQIDGAGVATGTGLAKEFYDALEGEYDAQPVNTPGNVPNAQNNLAKMARALAPPLGLAINSGVEMTLLPGQVVGSPIDASGPELWQPLDPPQLNAIVGSVLLRMLASLVMAERSAGETLTAGFGQFFPKDDAPNRPYFRDDTNVDHRLPMVPVPLTDLATIPAARVLGNQVDAVGAAAPQPLTGDEVGELLRFGFMEALSLAPGTYDLTIDSRTHWLEITPSADGDVVIRSISQTGGNAGGFLTIVKRGPSLLRRVLLKHDDATAPTAADRLFAPQLADYPLYANVTSVRVVYQSTLLRWVACDNTVRDVLHLFERSAGITLGAGQAQFFAKNDAPNNPYFRDDTNVDRRIATVPVPLSDLADQAAGTIVLRAIGSGSGPPIAGTAAQARAIVDSAPITEFEETGAGPFNDYNPAGARHIMCSNAAGVFTGVLSTGFVVGDEIIFSHQGTGFSEFQHNTGSALANRFFTGRQGLSLRIFDNELAIFRLVDVTTGGTTDLRWELQSPLFPFAHASGNANGDTLVHNGTNWVTVAGFQTTSTINLTPSGALGVVDITALASGGSVTLQPTAPFNIDGFTAKPEGFCFDLHYRDTTAHVGTLNENAGATTTSIRNPGNTAATFSTLQTVRMRYSNTRWRSSPPEVPTWLGAFVLGTQQNETAFTLGALNATIGATVSRLYILISGDGEIQTITPASGNPAAGRVVLVMIVGTGTKTIRHNFSGGGGGRLLCPDNRDHYFSNRQSFWLIGDGANGWLVSTTPPESVGPLLLERASAPTLGAGFGLFWVRNDAPNTPMFRDDTNVDQKLVRAPVPLSDITTIAQGTMLGRTALGGTGVPTALSGLQQGENLRRGSVVTDALTTGNVATYTLAETTTHVVFTGSGTITLQGATIIGGKPIEWSVDTGASVEVTFVNDGAPTITQERFRTPSGQPSVTIRAGESVSTIHAFNRHRMGAVCKRVDPELLAPVRNNLAGLFFIGPIAGAATGAAADDVVVYNANAPFPFRILRMVPVVTAGVAAQTVQARNALAGGGAAVSSTFDASVANDDPLITANLGLSQTIALNGTLAVRRSSGNVTGEFGFICVRT